MKKFLLPLVVFFATFGHAQVGAPPPELDVMKWTLGKWSGKVHWNMEGTELDETMDFDCQMDGMFVVGKTSMEMMGMKMSETAYTSFDPQNKTYKCYTFTSWVPTPRIETITVDATKMVAISEPWDGGMGSLTTSRSTMTKVSDSEMKFVLEFKEGDKWNKVGEGTLKKK